MSDIHAYDLDGVIASEVLPSERGWVGRMLWKIAPGIAARHQLRRAKPLRVLLSGPAYGLIIVTGRPMEDAPTILAWVRANKVVPDDGSLPLIIICNPYAYSEDSSLKHKCYTLRSLGVTNYLESDHEVAKQISENVPGVVVECGGERWLTRSCAS